MLSSASIRGGGGGGPRRAGPFLPPQGVPGVATLENGGCSTKERAPALPLNELSNHKRIISFQPNCKTVAFMCFHLNVCQGFNFSCSFY